MEDFRAVVLAKGTSWSRNSDDDGMTVDAFGSFIGIKACLNNNAPSDDEIMVWMTGGEQGANDDMLIGKIYRQDTGRLVWKPAPVGGK